MVLTIFLMPRPEPGPPAPPKDFRTWLRDSLSDDNVRYYLGPHLFEVLGKIHSLTQLLPGSGSVQSMEDSARANEELQQGNYGNAAAHLGMGTLNAGLDWVPPAKMLAIIGGAMAKTFPRAMLPTAMRMEAAGRSADEIWRATGLERAADGPWTFEISDKGYRVRPGERTMWKPVTVAPLYQHLDHPGMREAYPQFSDVPSLLNIHRPCGHSEEASQIDSRLMRRTFKQPGVSEFTS
jgi:Large polyvalent protein associated domain 23